MKKDKTKTSELGTEKVFPLEGMKYNDRFQMIVGEFGREVVIKLNRGKAVCSKDGKMVTITYTDSKVRGPRVSTKISD